MSSWNKYKGVSIPPNYEGKEEEYYRKAKEGLVWDVRKNWKLKSSLKTMIADNKLDIYLLRNIWEVSSTTYVLLKEMNLDDVRLLLEREEIETAAYKEQKNLEKAKAAGFDTYEDLAAHNRKQGAIKRSEKAEFKRESKAVESGAYLF